MKKLYFVFGDKEIIQAITNDKIDSLKHLNEYELSGATCTKGDNPISMMKLANEFETFAQIMKEDYDKLFK